jgi:2-dehydropantoate 2-reductase
MKIAVMGAGGVGGYFGGRLAASGQDVTFIARGEHLRAIQERGLRVESHDGGFLVAPAQATDDPSRVGPVDLVIFCVKMWDTDSAGELVRPMIGPGTGVVSFQNGVDNEERLAAILGPQHVLGGVAYVMSGIAEPGVVRQRGPLARLLFGELDGDASPRAKAFLEACRGASIDAELTPAIQRALWTKFLFLCAFSGMTTLTRTTIGPILQDPDNRQMFVACMREVEAVARARGVDLAPGVMEEQTAFADARPPEFTSSMYLDLERGDRLELEWLSGAVTRMGRELGIRTPTNQFIYAALKLHAGGKS